MGSLKLQIFKRRGGLHRTQLLERGCLERGGRLFSGEGCNFHIKNKFKSEIFNDKKNKKMFFSFINKNSNWEIITKNLVTFKRSDDVKDKKLGGSPKNPAFRDGGS